MSVTQSQPQRSSVSRIVSATGRLRNQHFLLCADHLMLELRQTDFQLTGAMAEGNVEVHMLGGREGTEYIVFGESAVYQAGLRRLVLNGWSGTREDGTNCPPTAFRREVILRTDGTFFQAEHLVSHSAAPEESSSALQAA